MLNKTKNKKPMKTRNKSGKRKDKLGTKKYNKQPKFKKSRKAGVKRALPVLPVLQSRPKRAARVLTPGEIALKKAENNSMVVEEERKTARAVARTAKAEAAAAAKAEVARVQSRPFIEQAIRRKDKKTIKSLPIGKKRYLPNFVGTIRNIMGAMRKDSSHLTPKQREDIPGKKEYYSQYIQYQIIDDGIFAELFHEADKSKKTKMLEKLKILADDLLTDAVKPGPANFKEEISKRLIDFYTDHYNNTPKYTKEEVKEAMAEVEANHLLGDESNNIQTDKHTTKDIEAALKKYIEKPGAGEYQVDIKT